MIITTCLHCDDRTCNVSLLCDDCEMSAADDARFEAEMAAENAAYKTLSQEQSK